MGTCPIEDFHYLIPITDFFKVHLLHRGTGNNHTVILLATHFIKVRVKGLHMFNRRILGCMTLYFHKRDFLLEWCIGQQTHQVSLCGYFQRHQVQNYNPQRTYILLCRTRVVNHKDIFFLQQFYRR